MQTSNTAKQVSATILSQLGGGKFIAMTGSKNFVYGTKDNGNDFLQMHLTRNKMGAKFLTIELNANDTYTMEFRKINRNLDVVATVKHEEVYCDMLCFLFTKTTGLFTSL